MSFNNLKVDELRDVADFFVVEVEQANPDKGATKKEILAALAAGDEPVTWKDYNEIYLPAKEKDVPAPESEPVEEEEVVVKADEAEADTTMVLVKYERKNPTWEVGGYLFSHDHPYKAVPEELAERLVSDAGGFRVALPSEVTKYYS